MAFRLLLESSVSVLVLSLFLSQARGGYRGGGGGGQFVGGRIEVSDVKTNEEVQDLGRFSVEEYNRLRQQAAAENGSSESVKKKLRFTEVVAAERQVVAGIKYFLKVSVIRDGGGLEVFDSVVVVKPWVRSKELLHFALSSSSSSSSNGGLLLQLHVK